MKMIVVYHVIKLLIATSICSAQGPMIEIQAVVRETANLPCDIKPPTKEDTAILVVWYRNEMDAIYSYDSRGKSTEKGSHWKNSSVVGNRAFFRTLEDPAVLTVDEVQPTDEGVYRCRVDFRKSQTKNSKIKLYVIIPPQEPVIYDQWKKRLSTVAGPYEEGTDVRLLCKVYGGHPLPMVKWFREETLLTSSSTMGDEIGLVESELIIRKVSRTELKVAYSCQANNNNVTAPKSATLTLDIYLGPLEVTILSSRQSLSADRKYEIVCQSVGSRPPAKISWSKGEKKLHNFTTEISPDGNVTTSTLTIEPTLEDHNKTLVCRAMNPKIRTGVVEDRWKFDISFVPVAKLQFGSVLLNPDDIEEGDDVYLQCSVHANPRAYKIVWKHNGFIVQNDPKSGVTTNYDKLILRSVYKDQAGNYSCFASNVEGDGESNSVELKIMYKPVCKPGQNLTYGIAISVTVNVSCEVDAFPTANTFRWSLGNQSQEVTEGRYRTVEKIRNLSVLRVKPLSDNDYGVLTCVASNAVGEQTEPCIFQIIPAGRPDQLTNCSITNETSETVTVICTPGYDGGEAAVFVLEMFDDESGNLLKNITSVNPVFVIEGLNAVTASTVTMNLYAENVQGRSTALTLRGFTPNSAEKRTGLQSSLNLTPYVILLLGFTAFCTLSTIVVLGAVKAHAAANTSSQTYTTTVLKKKDLHSPIKVIKFDTVDDDENNPDIIPVTISTAAAKTDKNQDVRDSMDESLNDGDKYNSKDCDSPEYSFSGSTSSSCRQKINDANEADDRTTAIEIGYAAARIDKSENDNKDKHGPMQFRYQQIDEGHEVKFRCNADIAPRTVRSNNNCTDVAKRKESKIHFKSKNFERIDDLKDDSKRTLLSTHPRIIDATRSISSQKEIITVRVPLMSGEQESCV